MKIAILGNGGREHALTFFVSRSKKIKKIYCIPGNAGTSEIAENISINLSDFEKIYKFLNRQNISKKILNVNQAANILDKLISFKITKKNIKKKINLIGQKILKKNINEINLILK